MTGLFSYNLGTLRHVGVKERIHPQCMGTSSVAESGSLDLIVAEISRVEASS